uniref:CG15247-PA n=1 Tax=Macrostomum lignano TaxID=282301 RepID=A0A1I8HW93_9PLAT
PRRLLEPLQAATSGLLIRRRRRRTKSEEVPVPSPPSSPSSTTVAPRQRLQQARSASRRQRSQSIAEEEGEDEDEQQALVVPPGEQQSEHQHQHLQQRSTVKQFFLDTIRPRAKSENAHTISRPKTRAAGDSPGTPTAATVSPTGPATRSPVGGLVSRLRHLATSDSDRHLRRRTGSSGQQRLPHPSLM